MKNLLREKMLKNRLRDIEADLEQILTFEPSFISERALFNLNSGGKRLRPVFVVLTAEYFGKYDQDIIRAASIMELIHMSSLIHDDVNDRADLRRGRRTINAADGVDVAVFIGSHILVKALHHVRDLPYEEKILPVLARTAILMSEGEVIQLQSLYDIKQTRRTYYVRIERKTALLIAICCKIGAILTGALEREIAVFYRFGYHLGMAYQIKDDLMDMQLNPEDMGKPTGNDLISGLVNLPLILTLEKEFPERERVLSAIANRFPRGDADAKDIVSIIEREGGFLESETIIRKHIAAAKAALDELPKRPVINTLKEGADYIHERTY